MHPEIENTPPKGRRFKRLFYLLAKTLFIFSFFLVITYSIFQLPYVQNYLKNKIIQTVEEKTGSKITFDHIAVNIWNGITLENFNLEYEGLPSLLSVEKLGLSLRKNIFSLYNNQLDISTLRIDGVSFHILTKYNETESNLSRFFKVFQSKSEGGKTTQFLLMIKQVFFRNISIVIENENKGVKKEISLKSGLIELDKLDLECREFWVNQIYFNGPSYKMDIMSEACFPDETLSIEQKEESDVNKDWFPFSFRIQDMEVENGVFGIFNHTIPIETKFDNVLDVNHFTWDNIKVRFSDVALNEEDEFFGICDQISFSTGKNFELKRFSIDTIQINKDNSILSNMVLNTGGSKFVSDISLSYFDYSAFRNMKEEVLFNVLVQPSYINLKEIGYFNKGFITNPATQGINDKKLDISGKYFGKLNGISGKNVKISIGNQMSFGGFFSTKNLNDYNNTLLNVRLENFVSSMKHIKALFPLFNPPANFFKLGNLRFDGRYDGYLEDFVAYGKLKTDLGSVDLDMRLDLTGGIDKALYSGELNLSAFNLAKWSGNEKFGLVYFTSRVKKGQGLTLKTLKSDLEAVVKSITFKGYEYKNFIVNGVFEKSNFDGSFEINDPNIDLKFDGNAEFMEKQAFLNFTSNIKNLDLYALHLSKNPFSIKASVDINASGSNLNDVLGNIDIKDLNIMAKDTSFKINEMHMISRNVIDGGKELKIWSELGDFQLNGSYDFNELLPMVVGIIKSNYPSLTKNLNVQSKPTKSAQKMEFQIALNDSKHFLKLAGMNNVRFSKLDMKGKLNSYENEISLAASIPGLTFGNDSLINTQVLVSSYKNSGDILLHTDKANIFGEKMGALDFEANSKGDSLLFQLASNEEIKNIKPVDIRGFMVPYEAGYSFSVLAKQLFFLGSEWQFSKNNRISVTKDFIDINRFELSDGFRVIGLDDIKNRGINAYVDNFDIDVVNKFLKDPRFVLSGLSSINVDISDVFNKDRSYSATVDVDDFFINKDPYGSIYINADVDDKGFVIADLNVGDFLTGSVEVNSKTRTIEGKARFKDAPLKILQYILAKGIQNTKGSIDATLLIGGTLKEISLDGKGRVSGGQTRLIYTGVTYYFDNQTFTITEKNIDLTGAVLRDEKNNPATIVGGLYHNRFKKFGVNTTIEGNNVIGLQTTIQDNPDYYGYAIGKLRAKFTGSFENVDMVIDATTNSGTQLSIPVGNSSAKAQNNVIRFEKRNVLTDSTKYIANKILKGIDLEMNLTLTPEANISIIFDADKGDVISGVGRGNMQIFIKRTGAFDIFGDYQIENGKYLFTVAQLPVAKPFEVIRGGTIRWTGDPVNATMDIQAVYKSRTSLRPFVVEYLGLASSQLSSQANQRQDVDVILKLGGTLYNPAVTFNLAFPNLVGDLATLADSKLRLLQNNELELNSQVFGLIMFNNFLPSNRVSDVLGTGGIQSMGINTLSEFLSSQLSLYITNLINLALVENGLLAGVDFEIGLRNNIGVAANLGNNNIWPDEIEFRLKNRFKFLDERVTLNMGGNYIFENQGLTYNQMLPDFSLELVLTENKKLKARVYGRQELIVQNTISPKVGIGLTYRTEFGSITDFEETLKKTIKDSILQK
ncbi:MAG: translocation/assembly module TamB domain-containing protein [Saprospiraceae bacterium]|nr:translocation/assembly module TamB domain-containing protein [Saprospiraceae bacterium]